MRYGPNSLQPSVSMVPDKSLQGLSVVRAITTEAGATSFEVRARRWAVQHSVFSSRAIWGK